MTRYHPNAFDWTEKRISELRAMWTERKTASQIAEHFGHGLTRNAVLGKAHRIGLGNTRPRNTTAKALKRVRKPKVEKAPPNWTRPDHSHELPVEPVADVVYPGSKRVTFARLKPEHCRFPEGDPRLPDFRYCGCRQVPGLPYCQHHAEIAYYRRPA